MASFRWKLLLCLAILLVHAPTTWAGEDEKEEECEEGEVKDVNGECFEEPSAGSVSTGFTLISSFTFLISLQFFMNHPDPDMKENAYSVISNTVSIFSAVLMFQSINGLIEDQILDPLGDMRWLALMIDGLHMLTWYFSMQIVIAKVTCAFETDEWRDEILEKVPREKRREEKEKVSVGRTCYGLIFAHLTGFASINFWTTLQGMYFGGGFFISLVPIPLALFVQLGLQTFTDMCREKYAEAGDGKKDWFEDQWDEGCEEAEDDIMGLTMSVLLVTSGRFGINRAYGHDCLPNAEQKEEGEKCEFERTLSAVAVLFLMGLAYVIALYFTKLWFAKSFPEEEEKEKKEAIEDDEEEGEEKAEEGGEEENMFAKRLERLMDVVLVTLSMSFSWCIFHSTHQFLTVANPAFLGKEENGTTLAVVLALSVTYIAFMLMRVLDWLADQDWTPEAVDDAIRQCMKAMSLFIGFAWEQTFDESVDTLAQKSRLFGGEHAPAIAKLFIGSGCIGVVFLAWKWYILPFVVREGWTLGYIYDEKELEDHLKYLADHNKDFRAFKDLQEGSFRDMLGNLAKPGDKEVAPEPISKPIEIPYQRLPGDKMELLELENQELRKRNDDLHKAVTASEKTIKDLEKSYGLLAEASDLTKRSPRVGAYALPVQQARVISGGIQG